MSYNANNYHLRKMYFRSHPIPDDDPRHGSVVGYVGCFCRCQRCRGAATKAQNERNARKRRNARDRARRAAKKLLTADSTSGKV